MRQCKTKAIWTFVVGALAVLCLGGTATAKLAGEYAKFAKCPYDNPEAVKCLYATVDGGEVVLGSKTVPILNEVALQGGYTEPDAEGFLSLVPPSDGAVLSTGSQPIPGGLLGIVAPENATPLVKAVVAMLFESGLNRVDVAIELARPANQVKLNENNLGGEIGPALKLPIKIHLENPLLGESCYVGSAASPIIWEPTTGATNPPAPNKSIKGTVGKIEFVEGGLAIETRGSRFVDNSWSAPSANGCGGPLSYLIDPIINQEVGLPSPAGRNGATLLGALHIASAVTVKEKATEGD